jgi:phosphopantothenoylcysteine decarboxylase
MNTAMWRYPVTARQIRVLEEEWGVRGGEEVKGKGSQEGWFEVLRPQEWGMEL